LQKSSSFGLSQASSILTHDIHLEISKLRGRNFVLRHCVGF
jgi:hypothetical protein